MAATLRELSASFAASPGIASAAPTEPVWPRGKLFLAGAIMLLIGAAVVSGPRIARAVFDAFRTSADAATESAFLAHAPEQAAIPIGQPIHREITGSGYVVAPETATVFAERGGRITEIHVVPGDTIAAGQPLLSMDDAGIRYAAEDAQLVVRSAELSLAAARIALEQAEAVLNRQTALNQRGVVAGERLEDARTAFLGAANAVDQAKATLAKAGLGLRVAEDRVADLTVRAPISGTVTQLSVHVGDAVPDRVDAIHDGVGLMTIARMDRLAIDADVTEKAIADLGEDLVGEAVLDAFPDRPFAFQVQRIAPNVNAARGTFELRLVPTDPPEGMRPGMAARIRIALSDPKSHTAKHVGDLSR
ncbi:efflux RND transporter periplasmic adaptor subunit [Sedimentitalea todarodis]|uniref:Efflux RND transporter periplasmic adaptor subunit n=2 Tax=Sedimentitalea todarodis TaxID=1631240 RepID=A0ABU3VJY1_9RHOB|nr:efflux RND transporter periplasmic adaptor subunit [Sedimentitalea todarodis]